MAKSFAFEAAMRAFEGRDVSGLDGVNFSDRVNAVEASGATGTGRQCENQNESFHASHSAVERRSAQCQRATHH